jgi:iron complex outermembrane recepter protein
MKLKIGAALLASTAIASPAIAESDGQGHAGAQLEEIVVTARRVEESLQSVPVSITALSGAALEQRSIVNLTDVGKAVPNLFVREGPQDPSSAFITIRGQAQSDSLITIDTAVGLYVDGVNYPRSFGMRSNMVDVERIEVLRGPQGTLYGKNTTGGAFSVITRNPTDEFGASIKVNAGNFATFGGQGVLNIPIADGVGLRLVGGLATRGEGFGSNAAGQELQTEDSKFVRGKLMLDPTPDLNILIAADYQEYDNGGPVVNLGGTVTTGLGATSYGIEKGLSGAAAVAAFQTEASGGGFWNSNGTFDRGSRFEAYGGSLDINWDITDSISMRSISSWRQYERDTAYDFDLSSATIIHPHTMTPYDRNATQEFQLLGDFDKVTYVIGLYGSDERGLDGSVAKSVGALTNFSTNVQDATVISRSLGIFGQATWEFADNWSLTGGLRYTSERKIMKTRNRDISLAGVVTCNVPVQLLDAPEACEGTLDNSFAEPSWLISLDHQLTDDAMVYGKVSHGFRGGGQNLRGTRILDSFQSFAPELVTEYEAGVKTELFDRRLRLNAAIYYDELSDVQRSVLVAAGNLPITIVTNAASATLYGGEIEGTFRATDHLTLQAGYSYNKAEYEEFIDFTGDRSAEAWPTPEWQFNASALYSMPTSFGSVAASIDYYMQADYNVSPASKRSKEVTQKSYGLLGARVSATFDDRGLEVALYGRNLMDEEYFTTGIGLESLGYNITFAGEPRIYGIELTQRFGGERR